MAGTLVERLTGQATAADVNTELQIVMPIDALLDTGNTAAAELECYGPLPADLARDILTTSKGRLWWRRLYAARVGGPIVGGDPPHRHFDGFLKKLIKLRDRRCRDPYCDAPIRHIDHIQRFSDGGLTIYPNGHGTCERGNYAREMPGCNIDAPPAAWTANTTPSKSPPRPATPTSAERPRSAPERRVSDRRAPGSLGGLHLGGRIQSRPPPCCG
jgi:hypothetical protein